MPPVMPPENPAERRRIPDPGFADDDGSTAAGLAAALAAFAADRGAYREAVAAVCGARLLVPVVALLGEVEKGPDGLAREKSSEMATVLITGRDGRRALLAFSSLDSMAAWDPQARPVPVSAEDAAASALHDGADALVLDVAGPVLLAIEGEDLRSLGSGQTLRRVGRHWGWTRTM